MEQGPATETQRAVGDYQEMGTDEQIGKLYMALGMAQAQFGEIKRSKTVSVRMREGGTYTFSYAPLEDLLHATRQALTENGLALLTPIARTAGGGDAKVITILAHKDGARVIATFSFPPKADIKDLAGQITYLRRYSYSALLNLAADDDDDNRPIREDRPIPVQRPRQQPTRPSNQSAPANGSQPVPAAPDGNANGVEGGSQGFQEATERITEMSDPDYLYMLRIQEAAKEVGIPVSPVKLPRPRLSLLSTANSLRNAVNVKRAAEGLPPFDPAPEGVGADGGSEEEKLEFATSEQIGEIEDLVNELGLTLLADPQTEEAWVFEDTDYIALSAVEADRMIFLLREQKGLAV